MIQNKAEEIIEIENKISEAFELRRTLILKKVELGKLIQGLASNVVLEINGKQYCLFYNIKNNRASIVPALSVKEAEIAISVNKLKDTGEKINNGNIK
jgi:hypothetical protein